MDEVQKQIIGYLLMTIIGAICDDGTQQIGVLFEDVGLVFTLGVIFGALEVAAYKWIRHTYNIPEELIDPHATPPT